MLLDVEIFRIDGDIGGEMSLTEDIRAGGGEEPRKGGCSFFTVPKLVLAGVKLEAGPKGWTWDGVDRPPAGGRIEVLSRPRVAVLPSQTFQVLISSDGPIQYFERRPDGLFELKEITFRDASKMPGLSLSAKLDREGEDRIVIRDLSLQLRTVGKRKPIEGVGLDVGEPVLSVREQTVTIAVRPGRDYGILCSSEGMGGILMRVRADFAR